MTRAGMCCIATVSPQGFSVTGVLGFPESWRADVGRTLTPAEQAAHDAKIDVMRQQREAEQAQCHADAASKAAAIYKVAQPALEDHPYLTRKGINAHGTRLHNGALVIPMRGR